MPEGTVRCFLRSRARLSRLDGMAPPREDYDPPEKEWDNHPRDRDRDRDRDRYTDRDVRDRGRGDRDRDIRDRDRDSDRSYRDRDRDRSGRDRDFRRYVSCGRSSSNCPRFDLFKPWFASTCVLDASRVCSERDAHSCLVALK